MDRVDRWQANDQTFLRVVDYKTGKKTLDYCDLEQGLGLQMLLYLFALEQGGTFLGERRVGAGVQYFPARAPYVPLSQKKDRPEKRSGMLLAEEDILKAMDDPASGRLCCKWDKEENLSGDIASRSQFRLLKSHVYREAAGNGERPGRRTGGAEPLHPGQQLRQLYLLPLRRRVPQGDRDPAAGFQEDRRR